MLFFLRLVFSSAAVFLLLFSSIAAGNCLDFESAWLRVAAYHPALEAIRAEIAIQEAVERQVSLPPNPFVSVEAENLGVSHPKKAEPPLTTYSIAQIVELGGKRAARRNLAYAEAQEATWETWIAYRDLRCQLMELFVDVSFHEEKAKIAERKEILAQEVLESISTQVQIGKVSAIQQKQASIALICAQVDLQKVLSELLQAKQKLSMMWGEPCPDFDAIAFDFYTYTALPEFSQICEHIFQTTDYQRAQQQICTASQNLKLQEANSIPDVTINVGYRVFENSHEHGWVVGAGMPIPIFNRNQGNIQKASLELSQAHYQLDELVRDLQEKALAFYEATRGAFEQSEMINSKILPEIRETVEMTQKGYETGKFALGDLLDARKTLLEIEETYIDALNEYHLNRSYLDRCRGEL